MGTGINPRGAGALAAAAALTMAGCGGGGTTAGELRSYVAQVEVVRLPVNALLNGADPIVDGLTSHRLTPQQASDQMNTLEQQFAAYARDANAILPGDATLRRIDAPYAATYLEEDSYLATLASDLSEGDYDNLPDTQDQQRLAIITWRVQLEVLAERLHVTLPPDIQQAGRGEIAPGPPGSAS